MSNNNFVWQLLLIDGLILLLLIFLIYLVFKRKENLYYENTRTKAKSERNQVVDILIENLGQPTLLLSKKGKVLAYNKSFEDTIEKDDVNQYVTNSKNIQNFIESNSIHKRKEVVFDNKTYYVDLNRIETDKFRRILITYTDISDLKDINDKQENFIIDVKHELNTPMTAILGLSDLLATDKITEKEEIDKIVKTINSEAHRLNGLIDKLTSTIESNINLKLTNMNDIFDDLRLIYLKEDNDIRVTFDNYVDFDFISDSEVIKQIIINLVNNSLKFTEEGYIKVSAMSEDNVIKIAVVDTGLGISEEEIKNIFERFYRIDKSRDRNTGGFGLGLSIVKSLLTKLDGTIEVFSNVNEGTTFVVSLQQGNHNSRKDL